MIDGLADRMLSYLKTQRTNGVFTPEKPAKAGEIIAAAKANGLTITDVDVRYAVHELRERGEPIGTYFYAWHPSELEDVEADLIRQAISMLRARSGIRKWKRRQQEKTEPELPLLSKLQAELELKRIS